NHVVPVLNLSVFNVRRAPAFAFEQSKRATIGGRFIRVDESRDLPLLHVVEDFTQKPVCSFAVTTGGEIKIDSAAPADRKSTRLNSSHVSISYAVFCLKKKTQQNTVY